MSLPAQENTKKNIDSRYNFHRFSYLKVSQAAKILGVSPSSLRRLEDEGKISSERIPGNNYRVYRLDLINQLKSELNEIKNLPVKEKRLRRAVAKKTVFVPEVIEIKPIMTNTDKAPKKLRTVREKKQVRKLGAENNLSFRKSFTLASFIIITFSLLYFPKNLSKSFSQVKGTLASLPQTLGILKSEEIKNKNGINYSEVLAARIRVSDFIQNFNLPVFFKKPVTFEQGITTTGVTFNGTGLMNNLLGIDTITKTTLEESLELDGEVTATDLLHTVIADGVIDETKLASEISYDGDFDFAGTWAIGGGAVDATAEELNLLSETTVTQGGIIFGDGTKLAQDIPSLFWDSVNKRLGIGTSNPTSQLTVTPNSAGAVQINPFGASTGSTGEIRFTELLSNGDNYIGFKSPDSLSENIIFTLPGSSAYEDYVLTWKPGNILTWSETSGDITAVGSMTSGIAFGDTSADNQWLGLGSLAGRIEFDDQGTDEVNILNANVGIGTSSPQYTLDVNGSINGITIATGNITAGTWSGSVIGVPYGGTGSSTLTQYGVLVGAGTGPITGILAGTTGQILLGITSNNPAFATLGGDATIAGDGTLTLALSGVTAGTYGDATHIPRIVVDNKGRITSVVNTTISYESPLTFSNGITRLSNDIKLGGTFTESTTLTTGNYDMIFNLSGTGEFRVQDNGSDVLFVSDSGNVGIGTTDPFSPLHVSHLFDSDTIDYTSSLYNYAEYGYTATQAYNTVFGFYNEFNVDSLNKNGKSLYPVSIYNDVYTNSSTMSSLTGIYNNMYIDKDTFVEDYGGIYGISNSLFVESNTSPEHSYITGLNMSTYYQPNVGSPKASSVKGIYNNVYVGNTASASTLGAADFSTVVGNNASVDNMYGLNSSVYTASSATATQAYGVYSSVLEFDSSSIDWAYSIYGYCGGATTCYGAYLESRSVGPTTNYGLYLTSGSASSNNYGIWGNAGDWILDENGSGLAGGTGAGGDLFFGESQNAALWYDGTNLKINPQVSGSGNLVLTNGNFLPGSNDSLNLGSDTARWADLFLGPGSLHIGSSSGTDEYLMAYDTTNDRLEFNFGGSGPAEMVINSSGNVGIGTTDPQSLLHIDGNVEIGTGSATRSLYAYNAARDYYGQLELYNLATGDTTLKTSFDSGDIILTPGTSGYVGIKTTSPKNALDVSGGMALGSYAGVNTSPIDGLIISGSVGIGTISPNDTLDVNGSIIATALQDSGKITRLSLGLLTESMEIDNMEYASDSSVQSTYTSSGGITSATGGTISTSGSATIHTFTTGGTLWVSGSGAAEVLVVAGGGGGGYAATQTSGGGGAGGLVYQATRNIIAGSYSATVGSGGAARNNGGNSTFDTITAIGGGRGGSYSLSGSAAATGGSGGGGAQSAAGAAATQTDSGGGTGYGYAGASGGVNYAGGGGGAGSAGTGSTGGVGKMYSISGSNVTYSKGGGGGEGTGASGNTPGSAGEGGRTAGSGANGVVIIRYIGAQLVGFSSSSTKNQGSYSLKATATQTYSLNSTLTKTVDPTLDFTGRTQIRFDLYASRTGSNIKIGFHDTGGTTTEITPDISSANTWETQTLDISEVSDANKNTIDKIIITIVNADAANTFYIDNLYSPGGDTTDGLAFITNSSERIRVENTGLVGIGTTTPTSLLDVAGTVQLRGTDGGTGLRVSSNGLVGIGTTDIVAALTVSYDSNNVATFKSSNPGTSGAYVLIEGISSAPANNDYVGRIYFRGNDSTGTVTNYNYLLSKATVVTNGSETSNFELYGMDNGAGNLAAYVTGAGTGYFDLGTNTFSPYYSYNFIPENMEKADFENGDVVILKPGTNKQIDFSTSSNDPLSYGVVHPPEGFGSIPEEFKETVMSEGEDINNIEDYPLVSVAHLGTAITKVYLNPGEKIDSGDAITSSSIERYGQKSQKAGTIIGKSMQEFDPVNLTCTPIPDISSVEWPEDPSKTNNDKPCFSLPDGSYIGKVMVFVNVSWYDPSLAITETGDLAIQGEDGTYQLVDTTTQEIVQNMGSFDTVKSANVEAGKIDAKEIFVNGIPLDQYLQDVLEETNTTEATQSTSSETISPEEGTSFLSQMEDLFNEFKDLMSTVGMTTQVDTEGNDRLVIDSNVNILGDVTLSDLNVMGNVQAGSITIDTIENSINVLGVSCYNPETDTKDNELCTDQTLYLQKTGSGNLDVFNGKLVIEPDGMVKLDGSIEVTGSIKTEKIIVDTTDYSSASAGKAIISKGETSIEIHTSAVTENSVIYVTPERPIAVGSKKTDIGEFEITIKEPETKDLPVNWIIVDLMN
ncbi:MAG: glycine-rich domain-containing protein [Patescibacteria group bacterium]